MSLARAVVRISGDRETHERTLGQRRYLKTCVMERLTPPAVTTKTISLCWDSDQGKYQVPSGNTTVDPMRRNTTSPFAVSVTAAAGGRPCTTQSTNET
jgi:hypothetical protein